MGFLYYRKRVEEIIKEIVRGYGVGNQTDSKYDFCDVLVLE